MTKIKLLNIVKLFINKPIVEWGFDSKSDKNGEKNLDDYGVKSHIREFYCEPDKDILKSGEYMQGDEFRFLVEPRKRKNNWVRFSLFVGCNLLLMGLVFTSVGYLSPQQEIIVGQFGEYIVVDRWADVYNNRLIICQIIGLLCLVCGTVLTFCALLLFHCEREQRREYYVMKSKITSQRFVEPPIIFKNSEEYWGMHCIPSSATVKGVQPPDSRNY